jgi:hypothetical protein
MEINAKMFVERKTYDIGGGKLAASYEIVDDYRNRVQLTPQETETLYQYLASKAVQIHNDVNGEVVDDLAARWKQPKTTTVYLLNGNVIETEINGKTLDGSSGYILIDSKDVNVDLIDGRWQESKRGKGWL